MESFVKKEIKLENNMPDVAHGEDASHRAALDCVGMSNIEIPVRMQVPGSGIAMIPSKADVYVSLDRPEAKGIHMSRLFLSLEEILADKPINASVIERLLHSFIDSHKGLSSNSFLRINFDLPMRKPSLKSPYTGWRHYPVSITGKLKRGHLSIITKATVAYSSTCPCSAALSRQLYQKQFLEDFSHLESVNIDQVHEWLGREDKMAATPHSQRSNAIIEIETHTSKDAPSFYDIISNIEDTLQTSVQAVVKREDEQEFARLNAENLMFCEDAARRIKLLLDKTDTYSDYRVKVEHLESLHPHDAVSIVTKGIPGGMLPNA